MLRPVLLRIGELVLVAFGVSLLSFLMIHLVPGDAAQVMIGGADATPARIAALRHTLGLDQPLIVQYARWIGGAVRGDFGTSVWTGRPVIEEIAGRVGVTAELALLGLTLAIALGVPAGCLMASLRSSAADYAMRLVSIIGLTLPSFWLGAMLLYGAGVLAPGLQVVGWVPFTQAPLVNLERVILPVIALSLPILASLARVVRAAMLDALAQDYVRTARAKGLSPLRVVFAHALCNALIPFTAATGIAAGYLFGGAVVVEQVFALPGLGRLMVGAIAERNYPLIQAAILLATLAFVAINFIVDLLTIAIDPRARRA
ncbi:MAG: ABC transporter permease [Rhodospirillales bacterium]|nr:ABC transporter permease [Rhodospirillales bacterium]MDE2575684.1 ABC transporter permease [Rhodospirillales bacterium]